MVERRVRERKPLGTCVHESGDEAVAPRCLGEHVRASIQTHHATPVAARDLDRDKARARRDIEDDIVRFGSDSVHERVTPARILSEREEGARAIVRARDAGEDPRRVG